MITLQWRILIVSWISNGVTFVHEVKAVVRLYTSMRLNRIVTL